MNTQTKEVSEPRMQHTEIREILYSLRLENLPIEYRYTLQGMKEFDRRSKELETSFSDLYNRIIATENELAKQKAVSSQYFN